MEDNDNIIFEAAFEIHTKIMSDDLFVRSLWRSKAARKIAEAVPSTLNVAFVEVMDNPKPFYDALRSHGLSDRDARFRISLLPIAATGGYGLKPEQFRV